MSYQVIARKWRPQTFREVVGQQHVTRTLENAILSNRVAHAYIFSGARGVGKTTTARILAKALNCAKAPTTEPCNACDSCREIAAGTSLDVMEIDAASNRGIDHIRELREMVRYVPLSQRHRVVILDEAHMLTDEASNALLKTLEEPPEKVIFVMATTKPEDLVETIRSRAQQFHFRALSFAEITGSLTRIAREEKLKIDSGALAVIARAAEGSLRDALSLLEQAIAYCGQNIADEQVRQLLGVVPEEVLDELVEAVAGASSQRALALVHALVDEGQNLRHFCREAIRHFRNILVARVNGAESPLIDAPADERPRLATAAGRFTEEDLTRFFEVLLETDSDLRRHPDPRMQLEMGLLRLVNASRLAPLEEVLAELRGESSAASRATLTAGTRPRETARPAGAGFAASAPRGGEPTGLRSPPAPKMERTAPVPASVPSIVAQAAGEFSGVQAAQVAAIKSAISSQYKFLSSLVEPVTRWVVDGGEMQLYFPAKDRVLADMLQAREQMEKLRAIFEQVMGQPLRVCVKLETGSGSGTAGPDASRRNAAALRAQIEEDPVVRAMLQRFGGQIREVKERKNEE